jgi:hypothetical protein
VGCAVEKQNDTELLPDAVSVTSVNSSIGKCYFTRTFLPPTT